MVDESLRIDGGGPGLQALLARAVGLDATASARLRQLDDTHVDVFVTTPFEVVASRRVLGQASRDGAVVSAQTLLSGLQAHADLERGADSGPDAASAADSGAGAPIPMNLNLGPARDPSWPGALPPAAGFQLVDAVPVDVVRQLADQGQALARQFSGPLGPPASLLNQTVLTVTNDESGQSAEVPMRAIFACTSLGLIPGFSAPINVPRHLRVATCGRWLRVDAPFGTVYRSSGLSLF